MIGAALLWLYKRCLHPFPQRFRAEFEEEMVTVLCDLLAEQARLGFLAVLRLGLRELFHLPRLFWQVHRREWQANGGPLPQALRRSPFQEAPAANDGRFSWAQAVWEAAPLAAVALLLGIIVYAHGAWLPARWGSQWHEVSGLIALCTLPLFVSGLLLGLPRWAYPLGGLLLGHLLFTAQGMFLFWVGVWGAALALGLAAAYTHWRRAPLGPPWLSIGRSLAFDWTRSSFAFYALLPYAILSAFDDTYRNDATPWFALALAVMVGGALVYSRARAQAQQFGALAAGAGSVLACAAIEQICCQRQWLSHLSWIGLLWAGLLLLLLLPPLAALLCASWSEGRTPETRR